MLFSSWWRWCRGVSAAHGISLGAGRLRRSYPLLTSWLWSCTGTQDRCSHQESVVCIELHRQRPFLWYWVVKCHSSCCSHCGLLCSYIMWLFFHIHMFWITFPSFKQRQRNLFSSPSIADFPSLMTSSWMESFPGAFLQTRASITKLLSLSNVGSASNSCRMGRSWIVASALHETVFSVVQVQVMFYPSLHLLSWSVITSPVLVFRGATFFTSTPVACVTNSNMPLAFPVSDTVCIILQIDNQ